jgi:hypothetical protein
MSRGYSKQKQRLFSGEDTLIITSKVEEKVVS